MKHAHMRCQQCGKGVIVPVRDGDNVWTAFCSPEHAHQWQEARTEDEIIEQASSWGGRPDRCQWCACTLKSGYHDEGCPVRAVAVAAQAHG
jgi:hypothetical protein